jgi:hypothetical protein
LRQDKWLEGGLKPEKKNLVPLCGAFLIRDSAFLTYSFPHFVMFIFILPISLLLAILSADGIDQLLRVSNVTRLTFF